LPSKNSSMAPPPVLTKLTFLASIFLALKSNREKAKCETL
jgi:hypothetical protein